MLHVDGASNLKGSGADLILASLEGVVTEYALRFNFNTSNNSAEYEASIAGLKMAKEFGIKRLKVFTDSQLIIGQIRSQFEAKDFIMTQYLQNIKDLAKSFEDLEVIQIPRSENVRADALYHLATLDFFGLREKILIDYLEKPSIELYQLCKSAMSLVGLIRWLTTLSEEFCQQSLLKQGELKGKFHDMFFREINYIRGHIHFLYFDVYGPQKLTIFFKRSIKKFMVITLEANCWYTKSFDKTIIGQLSKKIQSILSLNVINTEV